MSPSLDESQVEIVTTDYYREFLVCWKSLLNGKGVSA